MMFLYALACIGALALLILALFWRDLRWLAGLEDEPVYRVGEAPSAETYVRRVAMAKRGNGRAVG